MRIVYDDERMPELSKVVYNFVTKMDVEKYLREENWMERVQSPLVRAALMNVLGEHRFSIGNKAAHAYGIGNNCDYPVFYHPEDGSEMQLCGNINLNTGMFGELYIYLDDYNGSRVGPAYEVTKFGVTVKVR